MAGHEKVSLQLRLPSGLHAELKAKAKTAEMSLNGFLVERLARSSIEERLEAIEKKLNAMPNPASVSAPLPCRD